MTDEGLHDQISRVEVRIEELALAAERCRRIARIAQVAIAAGVLGMLAVLPGVVRPDPMILVAATAAILAGIVVFGSNASTARQIATESKAAETLRDELIGRIEFGVMQPKAGRIEAQADARA